MGINFVPEKPFCEYLKEKRKEKNLSVRALSKLSGVSQASILNYEKGVSQPNLINAINLAYSLEVSLKDLLFHIEEPYSLGIICYDLDLKDNFIIYPKSLNDEEKINHFCILKDKKILLFSEKEIFYNSKYLLKNKNTNEFKISSLKEDDFKIIGYFIRELSN